MRTFFLTTIFILISQLSLAELMVQSVNNNGRKEYFLSSNDCLELKNELDYFKSLTQNYSSSYISFNEEIDCSKEKIVSLDAYLPMNMRKLLEVSPGFYGPNCWNSVINARGLYLGIHFTNPKEFEKALSYYQCRKRSFNEKAQPGDIIRLFKNKEDFHSFIYISPHFSFSKNGPETRFGYDIQNTSSILRFNFVSEDCLSYDGYIKMSCEDQIAAYDCDNVRTRRIQNSIEDLLVEAEIRMTNLILNYRSFPSTGARDFYVRDLDQKLNALFFILNNDLTNGKLDPEQFKKEDLFMSRVLSMLEQMSYF